MSHPELTLRSLREIAIAHGSDKESAHHYADRYERHLSARRHEPLTLLEIGIGGQHGPTTGGSSLRMWKEYFARGQIVGIDIHDKSPHAEERITVLQGDQSDAPFLERVCAEYGPFDVIVDDGSHICDHVIASFRALFGSLTPGGIYVIEDLETSYWPHYLGSSRRGRRRRTTMTFLKQLADGLNHAEFDIPGYQPTFFDESIVAITLYHNLAFIERGDNREPSVTLSPHPRARRAFPVLRPHRVRIWLYTRTHRHDPLGRVLGLGVALNRRRRRD